jgi:hypothetical protein
MIPNRSVLATCALVALIAMSAVGVVTSAAGTAAPSSFELVLEGRYDETLSPEGEFTASGPFCSSGRMTTLQRTVVESSPRLLTCGDGSGSIIALVRPGVEQPGGAGSWKITSGTGDYAKLRGQGTFASHQTDPGSLDHGWFSFRSMWTGMAYVDDLAPAIDISRATAAKLRRPAGAYTLKLALALRDDVEDNPVRYTVIVKGGGLELARKVGSTASGTVSLTTRVRPNSTRVRTIRLQLTASDPVGNESSISRVVRLPRR